MLADSIDAYMRQAGYIADEDVVRSFFRSQVSAQWSIFASSDRQVAHLDRLLDVVFAQFTSRTAGLGQKDICSWVKEANTVFNVSELR